MMVVFALVGLALLSFALWAGAAFLLRLRKGGRLLAAVGIPTLFVTAWMWLPTLIRGDELGWAIFFLIVSVIVGGVAAILLLPVWYLVERSFGSRAP